MKKSVLACSLLMSGCATVSDTHDFLKAVESKAYDSAAKSLSAYCRSVADSKMLEQERIEARREIRQRGTNGPPSLQLIIPGLDSQTAQGRGPVLRIWCENEVVPDVIWYDLVR